MLLFPPNTWDETLAQGHAWPPLTVKEQVYIQGQGNLGAQKGKLHWPHLLH